MRPLATVGAFLLAFAGSSALGDPSPSPRPEGPPYRLWWSLPLDDDSAIEVDDAEVGASKFGSRWRLAVAQGCKAAPPRVSIASGGGPVLRELKVETLDANGQVRTSSRCVHTLAEWKRRLGGRLAERLEDELDAHISFLHPRHAPGVKK